MKYKQSSLLIFMALTMILTTSCSRLGINEKAVLICATGGVAGTVLAQQSRAGAVASFASALLPATEALIVNRTEASPEQMQRATEVGRSYNISPAKLKYYEKQKINHIAVKTSSSRGTRGTSVMLYNIQSRKLESNEVFDVRVEPEEGSKLKFDSYITEYVGDGNST